ncbi:MAG: hypothetical protein Q8Q13_02515, partial [bacterium]|nr:hypothetical protein [bacterium]
VIKTMTRKKILLIVSALLSVGLLAWNYVGNYRVCDLLTKAGSASNCPFILTEIGINLLPIIPLFLFSLITYRMREEVYTAWFRFVRWWIPLSMFLILIAPEYSNDWMYPVEKGGVAFAVSIVFCVVSILIIAMKYISLRKS